MDIETVMQVLWYGLIILMVQPSLISLKMI
jgi:hypothetical protein